MARLLVIGLGTAAGLLATLFWLFEREPVSAAKLANLNPAMTRPEVEALLGKPSGIYQANEVWAYSKPLGWSIVYVYFDESGRFRKSVLDR